ncbi:MAG: heavy metal translocating P-type ATPase [bacterium]
MRESLKRRLTVWAPLVALLWLGAGGLLATIVDGDVARVVWTVGLVTGGLPLLWRTMRAAFAGQFATDVVASLAVLVAFLQHEPLAGLVVVLMQTTGEGLERYAEGRASDAVRALEEKAPRRAHVVRGNASGATDDVDVNAIRVADILLVRPGEMLPCDSEVVEGASNVDTSQLTGEPVPVRARAGTRLLSGSINIDGPLTVRATALAMESQYARIVEMVRTAQSTKAPLQRLANRYAVWFTPATLAVCAIAYLLSSDFSRVLAVLVVATPCPLILATPVAIIGGINRAARRLIVVRNGGALEQLASVDTVVFDKTGTVTVGRPAVSRVIAHPPFGEYELLALAAAVEERSGHLLARSVVQAAMDAGLPIVHAANVTETPGRGVHGDVDGRVVMVGSRSYLRAGGIVQVEAVGSNEHTGGLRAHVAIDGILAGTIEFADMVRPGLPALFGALRRQGVQRLLLLSGDSVAHTAAVAAEIGIDDARGDLLPGDKVAVVQSLVDGGARVLMVGDGTNDAPALSAATVGLALSGHGGGITAEAADVVLLSDDLSQVGEVVAISQRTLHIARQSIWVGLVMSGVAMGVAAAGFIPPVIGAVLQEVLDVAVILNALRSSGPGIRRPSAFAPAMHDGPPAMT